MNGADILEIAKDHLGENYILGAHAPLQNSNWRGPWDCAEFCSWVTFQTFGIIYGCGTQDVDHADPYSGAWADDANTRGRIVPVSIAARTPGAFLIRRPVAALKRIGHVAITTGVGTVYEAAGAKLGVREGPIAGRRWDLGVLLPGVDYVDAPATDPSGAVSDTAGGLILRREEPPVFSDQVVELQIALKAQGVDPGRADGLFGPATEAAVYSFQVASGLVPDGEVGPQTGPALGLQFWQEPATQQGNMSGQGMTDPTEASARSILTDAFGAVVNTSTAYSDIRGEYVGLFNSCEVQDKHGEIAELARRIGANQSRYQEFVQSLPCAMPWFFVALVHAMEASGDVGLFRTHLYNGDLLTRPTVHVPSGRPRPNGTNFSWEESAKGALDEEGFLANADWSLPRMLFLIEKYNGMGPRKRGHATAYLWSYSNLYTKGKFIADRIWSDEAVSKQPGAAAILKQLIQNRTVNI